MSFDPYAVWLGVSSEERPPDHYRLLGLDLFESRAAAIDAALSARIDLVRRHAFGCYRNDGQRLLLHLGRAYACLCDPAAKMTYDRELKAQRLQASDAVPSAGRQTASVHPQRDRRTSAAQGAGHGQFDPRYGPLRGGSARQSAMSETRHGRRRMWWPMAAIVAVCAIMAGTTLMLVTGSRVAEDAESMATPPAHASHFSSAGDVSSHQRMPSTSRSSGAPDVSVALREKRSTPNPAISHEEPAAALPSLDTQENAVAAPRPVIATQSIGAATSTDVLDAPDGTPQPGRAEQSHPPPPRLRDPAERAAYLQHVRTLLDTAVATTARRRSDAADAAYHAASGMCTSDPRLKYAYGLALLKINEREEALKHFESAISQSDYPYLPAHQAAVRIHVEKKSYDAALRALVALAQILEKSRAPWPDTVARTRCAAWMGRLVAFLLGPAGLDDARTGPVALYDAAIEELLSPEHRAAYAEGRLSLVAEHDEFVASYQRAEHGRLSDRQKQQDEQLAAITERRESIEDRQEQLEMTAEKWRQWATSEVSRIDPQLAELERAVQNIRGVRDTLGRSLWQLQARLFTRQQLGPPRPSPEHPLIDHVQDQLNLAARHEQRLMRSAAGLLSRRRWVIGRYHRATGQILEENRDVEEQQQRLLAAASRLKEPDEGVARADELRFKQELLEEQKQDLLRSAADWQEWYDQKAATLNSTLTKLKAQYDETLSERLRNLREVAFLDRRVSALKSVDPSQVPTNLEIPLPVLIGALELTQNALRLRNDILDQHAAGLRAQALMATAEHQQESARYQTATNQLALKSDVLREWEEVLQRPNSRQEQTKGLSKPAPGPKRARSFRTWLPLDFEAERRLILDSYANDPASTEQ